jgi:hypothetical protein
MVTGLRDVVTMLINNNNRERKPFFSWTNSGSIVYVSVIIALSLLGGISFVFLSPPPTMMGITTAVAQEENNNNNTATAGAIPATTDGDTNTTSTTNATTAPSSSSSGLHLSPQPIWKEQTRNTGVAPFNQTHSIVLFFGNATLTVPDTGETINVTNNGTAISSSVTGTSFGRESVFSEDGDSTAITFYEIAKSDPATPQTKGIRIAVFDSNATGSLAPFNGMIVVGLHDEQPNQGAVSITLWKWEEDGIGNSGVAAATPPMQQEPVMNTTTSDIL